MKTHRIKINERRSDRARNVHRVFLEVDCIPVNGQLTQGHRLQHGKQAIEVYTDRIPAVAELCSAQADADAYVMARRLCAVAQDHWLDRAGIVKGTPEAEKALATLCAESPERYLQAVGHSGSPGPFRSVRVLTRDQSASIPLGEWDGLDEVTRERDYLIDPPPTQEGAAYAQANANQQLADVLAKALAASNSGNSGNGGNAKSRGRS